jgi:hypothetical protein
MKFSFSPALYVLIHFKLSIFLCICMNYKTIFNIASNKLLHQINSTT